LLGVHATPDLSNSLITPITMFDIWEARIVIAIEVIWVVIWLSFGGGSNVSLHQKYGVVEFLGLLDSAASGIGGMKDAFPAAEVVGLDERFVIGSGFIRVGC
jgi:hypothetical protein